MKKLLFIIVLSLFFNSTSFAKLSQYEERRLIDNGTIKVGMFFKEWKKLFGTYSSYSYLLNDFLIMCPNKENIECGPGSKSYLFEKTTKRGKLITDFLGWKSFNNYKLIRIDDKVTPQLEQVSKSEPKALKHLAKINQNKPKKNKITNNIENDQVSSSQTIEFNISKKKEQCEAIGFKPETEKFADCVLRLVELDVKTQQNNQIIAAENAGNQELVNQLERQRNLQASQALIDLGRQLSQPRKYNSKIYHPKTQNCILQGFGTFSKMTCN